MARISYRMALRSFRIRPRPLRLPHLTRLPFTLRLPPTQNLPLQKLLLQPTRKPVVAEALSHESVTAVYSAASCHHTLDGWSASGRLRCVSPVTGFRASAGGLSDYSNSDVLPRRQPGRHGLFRYPSSRTRVRRNSRSQSDDLDELLWQLRHHSAI